ncbi:MAG: ATP-binding cassette domain-containing protein [Candidatus Zixiibacteriota bacterium]
MDEGISSISGISQVLETCGIQNPSVWDLVKPGGILLKLDQVTKVFGPSIVALDHVSFQMERGDFCFLLGPNGSGKTTFLKLPTLEERPSEGEVVCHGFSSRTIGKRQIPHLRRKLGWISPEFPLMDDMDVFDNVALSLRILSKREAQIKRQVGQVLEMVGLGGKGKILPGSLSSGDKQKAAIARAVVRSPWLLLADEPTTGLDQTNADEILGLFKKINLLGTGVLVATQDSRLCPQNGARIVKIDKGRLL